jgi:hypothetical protein
LQRETPREGKGVRLVRGISAETHVECIRNPRMQRLGIVACEDGVVEPIVELHSFRIDEMA